MNKYVVFLFLKCHKILKRNKLFYTTGVCNACLVRIYIGIPCATSKEGVATVGMIKSQTKFISHIKHKILL